MKIVKKILRNPEPSVALLHYRATPTTTGYSPAQLLFGRNIKTTLPSVNLKQKPWTHSQVKARDEERRSRMKRNFDRARGVRSLPQLRLGRKVFVEDAEQRGEIVCKREEPRSYDVRLEDGTLLRRNRKFLHPLPTQVKTEPAVSPEETPVKPKSTNSVPPQDSRTSTLLSPNSRQSPEWYNSATRSPILPMPRKSLSAPSSPMKFHPKESPGHNKSRMITQPRTGSGRYNLRSRVRS